MSERDARLRKLRIRSWRRGTKEMDLILGPFADDHLAALDAEALDAYEALLSENDQDLYRWAAGTEATPERHAPMLDRIMAARGSDTRA